MCRRSKAENADLWTALRQRRALGEAHAQHVWMQIRSAWIRLSLGSRIYCKRLVNLYETLTIYEHVSLGGAGRDSASAFRRPASRTVSPGQRDLRHSVVVAPSRQSNSAGGGSLQHMQIPSASRSADFLQRGEGGHHLDMHKLARRDRVVGNDVYR